MIKNFSEWLNEGWMSNFRDVVVPVPMKDHTWRKAEGNVTPDTLELLKKLQPNFHEIALFSWHPNIKQAQYYDGYHERENESNYNSRSLIEDSIIVLSNSTEKNNNTWQVISREVDSFGYMKTSGGNGRTQDGKESKQTQISFLTGGVGTHEEARKIKNEKLTPGAYSYNGKEWMFIPADDFDTTPVIFERIKKTADIIQYFLESVDKLETVTNTIEKKTAANFTSGYAEIRGTFKDKSSPIRAKVLLKGGDQAVIEYSQSTPEGNWWQRTYKNLPDFFKALAERNPQLFTAEDLKEMDGDIETFVENYRHRHRGSFYGKKFGI
jgi:hypothetical protein